MIDAIELSDLATFVAVVETASFTEAARRLNTTKSVVSRRIGDLEKNLGVPVLDRSSRSVRATEVGAVYYAKCVRILESVGAAHDFVAGYSSVVKGRLRIAVPREFGGGPLLQMFDAFAAKFPEVLLDIDIGDPQANLSDSHFDVALRSGKLGDSNLVARALASYRHWLCASPAYLDAQGEPQSLDDLALHDGLIDADRDAHGHWQLHNGDALQTVRVRERLRSSSAPHLLDAAIAGLGIALLPAPSALQAIGDGRLRVVLAQHAPPAEPLSLVYPRSRRTSPPVQSLLQFLAEKFSAPTTAWDAQIEALLN